MKGKGITLKQVQAFLNDQEVAQVEKGPKKKEFMHITGPLYSYQADLLFIKRKKYKTPYVVLNMVNINSRKGHTRW